MNKTAYFLAAAAIAGGLCGHATAQLRFDSDEPRYYIGLHGGANQIKEWPAKVRLGAPVVLDGAVFTKVGYAGGIQIGRQTENARFELEYQQGGFKLKGIELGPVTESVSSEQGRYRALTLNAYRTGAFSERWGGYVGLGIGFGRAQLPAAGFSSGCDCFPKVSGNGLVLLARLGTEYKFDWAGNHRAFLQYTWLSMRGPSTSGAPGIEYDRKVFGTLTLGYRYVFD